MSSKGKPKKKTVLQKPHTGSKKAGKLKEKKTPKTSNTSEAEIINFFERVTDGFVALDKNWHYRYVNTKGAQLLGKKPEELIGKHIWTVFPEGVGQPFHLAYEKSMTKQIPIVFENHYEPWNRWFENRIYPSEDGITIYYTEITERKLAEIKLRDNEKFLHGIVETVPDGIVTMNMEGQIVYANKEAERILGLTRGRIAERVYDDPMWKITAVDGSPFPVEDLPFMRVVKTNLPVYGIEHAIELPEGQRVILSINAAPVLKETGELTSVIASISNISKRKRTEQLLVIEHQILEKISRGSPLSSILEVIVLGIEALSQNTIASILLVNPDELHVHYGAAPHLPEAYNQALEGAEIGPRAGSCGTAVYRKEPVIVSDIETDPLWDGYRELARTHGLRACWSTPIINSNGKVLGTFAMYYKESRSPKEEDFALIERAAYIACIAIEQRLAEESLKESDKYNRTLFEHSPVGLALTNMNGRLVDVNPAYAEIIGRTIDDTLNLTYWDITPEKYAEQEQEQLQNLNTLGRYGPYEKEYIHKDGHFVPVQLQGLIIEQKGDKYIWSSVENITERKRAEEALKKSERQLRQIMDGLGPYMFVGLLKKDGTVVEANQPALTAAGLKPEDVIGHPVEDTYWWSYSNDIKEELRAAIKRATNGEFSRYDVKVRAGEGELIDLDFSMQPFRDESGEIPFLIASGVVITERKKAEEALRRHRQMLQLFVEHAPASIAMFDTDMKYMAFSRRYLQDYQLGNQQITGRSHYEVFPEISDRWKEIHRRCLAGAIEKAEADPFPRQDGSIDWVRWEIHPWYEQGGKIGGIFLFSEVITDRILAENKIKEFNQQLRELASHIESIREEERSNLAREIHDVLGQMLTAIKIDISLLSASIRDNDTTEVQSEINGLEKIIDKAIQSVRNIATELRPSVLNLGLIPAIEWQAREFEKRFRIVCNLQAEIPEIAMEPTKTTAIFRTLQESLTNVLRHARATRVDIQLSKTGTNFVLRIIDNGRGIEYAEIENMKSLGLLGMKERALMIGGKLTIEGTHGSGTSVTLEVPFQN